MNPETASRAPEKWTVFIALGALVFFSRAWLIRAWGSPLPFWDQWDAEAIGLYGPWINGTLHWTDLFKAHNEHRIVLTRLADLALFTAYRGWNPWAQVLLNAQVHATTALILIAIFWAGLVPRRRAILVMGTAILFTSACGWQNALYGFQSQVYFADLLDVIAIAGLCGTAPFCRCWWIGLVSAGLAFFSNAGGNFNFPWIIRHSPALTAASGIFLLGALALSLRKKSHRPDPAVAAQAGSKQ